MMISESFLTDPQGNRIGIAWALGCGKWKGCDWLTHFGRNGLNLMGVRASDALLMAGATTGRESAEWREAAAWLRRIEDDASEAEFEALMARNLALNGNLSDALQRAERACALESHYREPLTWRPLRDAVEAALPGSSPPDLESYRNSH